MLSLSVISLPLIPIDNNIDAVLGNASSSVAIVKYYNSTSETWSSYDPGFGGNLGTMEDGKGYWIFMDDADTLIVNGTEDPVYDSSGENPEPVSYSVIGQKWNLIGFKSVESMDKSVYGIDSDDSLQEWNGSSFDSNNTMNPGLGYWLYAEDDDNIIPPIN